MLYEHYIIAKYKSEILWESNEKLVLETHAA